MSERTEIKVARDKEVAWATALVGEDCVIRLHATKKRGARVSGSMTLPADPDEALTQLEVMRQAIVRAKVEAGPNG